MLDISTAGIQRVAGSIPKLPSTNREWPYEDKRYSAARSAEIVNLGHEVTGVRVNYLPAQLG